MIRNLVWNEVILLNGKPVQWQAGGLSMLFIIDENQHDNHEQTYSVTVRIGDQGMTNHTHKSDGWQTLEQAKVYCTRLSRCYWRQ